MSFVISVKSDLKKLSSQFQSFSKSIHPKVIARTLNRVAASVKAASAKYIAPKMNCTQRDAKRRIAEDRAFANKLWASIIPSGRPLKLIAFKARQSAKGVVAKAWGKSKLYKRSFIAPVKHGSSTNAVYVRKGNHSLPVKQLWGAGVVQLFKQKENLELMVATVKRRFSVELVHNMRFYLNNRIRNRDNSVGSA